MPFSRDQLTRAAVQLSKRPAGNNPAINRSAISQLPANQQPIVAAVLASPVHAAIAAGNAPASAGMTDGGVNSAGTVNTGSDVLGQGPQQYKRTPTSRHNVLGFAPQAIGSGQTLGCTATPFAPFKGTRMIVGASTIAANPQGSVAQIQVGVQPQFAALGSEPISGFAAGLNGGFVDFDEASPAIGIACQVTLPGTGTFIGAVVGTTTKRKNNNRPTGTKVQRLPIPFQSVNAGSTTQVQVLPTIPFYGRKIVLDDANATNGIAALAGLAVGTGASSFTIQNLYVGSDPQFMHLPTSGAAVPGSVFSGLYDLWLDLDMADIAVPYLFQIQNIGTVTAYFGGVAEGDVQRSALGSYGSYGGTATFGM